MEKTNNVETIMKELRWWCEHIRLETFQSTMETYTSIHFILFLVLASNTLIKKQLVLDFDIVVCDV